MIKAEVNKTDLKLECTGTEADITVELGVIIISIMEKLNLKAVFAMTLMEMMLSSLDKEDLYFIYRTLIQEEIENAR